MKNSFRNLTLKAVLHHRAVYCVLLALIGWPVAMPATVNAQGVAADAKPSILDQVSFSPQLNAEIPLDLQFRDENGANVALRRYFGKKPIVLALVYYTCPTLCDEVIDGIALGLRPLTFDAGKDFEVVAVSINPQETPADALSKKQEAILRYHHANTDSGWHFLTGNRDAIDALANAAGFRYAYDARTKTFAHASGILVLTPEGRISRYFYGIEYESRSLKLALLDASAGKAGSVVDHILLYCYEYNPATGKYGTAIARLIFWSGIVTVLSLAALIVLLFRSGLHAAAGNAKAETAP